MRRCPNCNQHYADEWLTFCTQDGTSLVEIEPSATEPPPTLVQSPMPPSVSPTEQPTLDMPDRLKPPAPPAPMEYIPPPSVQAGWAPPPPPPYPVRPQQSLAAASLVCGIISITLGWCCSFGILTAPIALVMGIIALVQIKNEPAKYGGKGMAIGGVVTGALYFAVLAVIILLYGIGFILSGVN